MYTYASISNKYFLAKASVPDVVPEGTLRWPRHVTKALRALVFRLVRRTTNKPTVSEVLSATKRNLVPGVRLIKGPPNCAGRVGNFSDVCCGG